MVDCVRLVRLKQLSDVSSPRVRVSWIDYYKKRVLYQWQKYSLSKRRLSAMIAEKLRPTSRSYFLFSCSSHAQPGRTVT